MPTPHPGTETRDEFMQRCIPQVLDDGTAEDSDQAVAICSSMWEEATKNIAICPQPPKDKTMKIDTKEIRRAYSLVHMEIKQANDEKRIITGVATTPTPDRVGDIIEPLGVEFKNPLPLLLYHKNDKPVGNVNFKKPTKSGINFEARLPKIENSGVLKARVDEAWDSIKAGLIKGVSIGFRAKEASLLDDGGVRFIETEVLELSLVTVPANQDATIETIKAIDVEQIAASGNSSPGVPGTSKKETSIRKPEKRKMKTVTEQISAFEAKREKAEADRVALMEKSAEEGETLDEADSEEYDRLTQEVESLGKHLDRLCALEKHQATTAKPVNGNDPKSASESRSIGIPRVSIKAQDLPPGIAFARIVKCVGMAQGNRAAAYDIAKKIYPDTPAVLAPLEHAVIHGVIGKANVGAGSVDGTTWAKPLVGDETSAFADFVEWLRPQTIIGKFGTGGIPSLRRIPFRVPLITQTSGGSGYWVGEGAAKPLTKFDFSRRVLEPLKVANIAVLTKETIRDSNPSAETVIRDQLAAALIQKLDADFIDPDSAGTTNVQPASVTNGATTIVSVGTSADNVRTDIAALVDLWIAQNNKPTSGVWLMNPGTAMRLGLMTTSLGTFQFPGVTMNGGTFFGLPVITSESIGYSQDSPGEGRIVVLLNASDIYLADEGGVEIDMSEEATLTMDDAPTGNAITPTASGAPLVSLWQTNSVGFRAERTINWLRRRTEAVAVLDQVRWGQS